MLRMVLAFVTTHFAGLHAGLESGARRRGVEGSLAREDPSGRLADVGAIEAEADAADHRLYLRLREVRVGVGGAGLGTVEARLDAFHERVRIHGWLTEVGLGQWCSVRHGCSLLSEPARAGRSCASGLRLHAPHRAHVLMRCGRAQRGGPTPQRSAQSAWLPPLWRCVWPLRRP